MIILVLVLVLLLPLPLLCPFPQRATISLQLFSQHSGPQQQNPSKPLKPLLLAQLFLKEPWTVIRTLQKKFEFRRKIPKFALRRLRVWARGYNQQTPSVYLFDIILLILFPVRAPPLHTTLLPRSMIINPHGL